MTEVNFAQMSSKELVEWYNGNVEEGKRIKKFSDRKAAERRCAELLSSLPVEEKTVVTESTDAQILDTISVRPNMSASLKLDRRITCLQTGQIWKNAHTMWVENPEWMTSSQQDRLTSQLYKAAKDGQKITVKVNGFEFQLLNI